LGGQREGVEWVVREGVGAGGKMNQALYAHMNNKRKMKKKKSYVFLTISYVFSSTNSENKRAEQVLPQSGVRRRWSKQCIHM
jgi:hypothetical protein